VRFLRSTGERRPAPTARQNRQVKPAAKQSVFSYYANRSPEQGRGRDESRPTARPPQHFWQRTWIRNLPSLVALVAISLCVLYCLGLSTNPIVVVSANSPQSVALRKKSDYQQGAQKILERSILSRTKFTINSAGFDKAFQTEFPEVADVSLALPIVSRRPIVTISTAQPQILLAAQNKVYVLDKRGTVIMMANDLSSSIRETLPVVTDQSGLSTDIGKTALPSGTIQFITTVVNQLHAKQVSLQSITLPAIAQEVDMKPNSQPYFIKFNVNGDAREEAGSFLASKQKLEQTNSVPGQYIDVRVPGRAYYQ
jgi:hypothetical protein